MNYLPASKHGDCTKCPAKDTACVKVGKELICIKCNNAGKTKKQIFKAKQRNLNNLSKKVKSFAKGEDAFRDGGKSKSELLKLADKLFSRFIRNRDADKFGNVLCVCCGNKYNVEDKDEQGDKIVQCMHFIKRSVYSLRYSEENCAAGCKYCNKDMADAATGKAYQQFKERLIADLGETEVAEMEVAHRKINRIETVMLKNIIDHYS